MPGFHDLISPLIEMNGTDIERTAQRSASRKRLLRNISEVTADNLSSRLRLDSRHSKAQEKIDKTLLHPTVSSAQAKGISG